MGLAAPWLTAAQLDRSAFVGTTLRYVLPAGSRQGRGQWWRLHLHFRIVVDSRSGDGRFYVVASTNHRTCASVRFTTVRRNGRLSVTSDALGLVNGREVANGPSLVREIRFDNYVQYKGVRPGPNELALEVDRSGLARVRAVRFFPDSGLIRSRVGPTSLRQELFLTDKAVRVGDAFSVRVRVTRVAGAPVRRGQAGVEFEKAFLRLASQSTMPLVWHGNAGEAAFRFVATRAGRPRVNVVSEAAGTGQESFLEVPVAESAGSRLPLWPFAAGAGLLLIGLLACVGRRARRHA